MALHGQPPRTASARRTMAGLLLIPLLSLAALWGFTASITLGNVIRNQRYNTLVNTIGTSVIGLEKTLGPERALTLLWLNAGRRPPQLRAQLLAARRDTDTAIAQVRTATESIHGLLSPSGQAQLGGFLVQLTALTAIRDAVDAGTDSPVTAFTAYSAISSAEYGFLHSATPPVDPTLNLMTQAAIAEAQAEDFTAGATTLIKAALAARGQLIGPERVLFDQVIAEQNLAIQDTFALADPQLAEAFRLIFSAPAYRQLLATENRIIANPASLPVLARPADSPATLRVLQGAMSAFDQPRIGAVLAAESAQLSDGLLTELYVAGGLGLVAVVVSVFVTARFGRRLRGELTSLYDSARQMADERLPHLVERLRRGEDVDVTAESPAPRAARITEIANVARAFSTVQRTAVEAAVGQASLRKGVNQVFVSLSLRNQSLLHRQLGMLDDMERATSDPVALADLFRLDHLTTRMRRHAEGLLILSGATPGRGWSDPVAVADVLNAAVAEVEDYVRVEVTCEAADAVNGTAVNDVIHLLAELVENATVFSPPSTRVEIRGEAVGHGFAVEIEDRGLGMTAQDIATHNQRLAAPPEFDLASSDQLGLFVAAALAARHQIRLSLRPSPYGGITAIALLPLTIIVPAHDPHRSQPTAPVNGLTRESGPVRGPGSAPPALEPAVPTAGGWFSRGQTRLGDLGSDAGFSSTGLASARPGDVPGTGTARSDAAADGSRPDLPRRVRQASLAPQLRQAPAALAPPDQGPGLPSPGAVIADPPERPPEEAGGMLSALQAGWERARAEDPDYSDGEEHP